MIGAVEFDVSDVTSGNVHYALAEEHWNQGLMTEAVRAVLVWGFQNHPALKLISTDAMTVNKASIRVMEKCGMTAEEHKQAKWEKFEHPVDLAVYSISRDMWASQRTDETDF